jgi:competence/damage-inducible protein CinA-like protein
MRPIRSAEIVAVGSELLTPSRLDTNSLAVSERLRALGISLRAKTIVGDRPDDLDAVFRGALGRSDLVVLTGGLGPTDDDVTRDVVAATLGLPLDEDPSISAAIAGRFRRRGLAMPEINRRQAMVPRGATVIANPNGTAPGLYIETEDQVIVLLPGPPRELLPMLEGAIRERLERRTEGTRIYSRVVRVFGRSESHAEEAVRVLYGPWALASPPIEVTILAARGAIDLHLTVRASSEDEARHVLASAAAEAADLLGDDAYSDDGESIESVVGRLLSDRGWRLAAAESCTGGLLLKRLTDLSGSSAYVECGVVSYSNRSKTDLVGVAEELIAAHGAVSEPVAEAMAIGIRTRAGVEVGVGITGIAGPTGGSEAKPVGTVVLAVDAPGRRVVRTRRLSGGRDLVRDIASHAALDMVRRVVTGLPVP